jgi:hypothetical protein
MLSFRFSVFGLSSLVTLCALAAGACSQNSAAPAPALLTQAQADSLGEVMSFDVEDEVSGATMSGVASYSAAAPVSLVGPAACVPVKSPASPTDTDGDGVRDSVRLDFSGCVFGWVLETDSVRGGIALLDPTKTLADHAVERIFANLALVRVNNITGKWTSETRNGIRTTSRDTTTLQNSETNLRTDYVFRNGGTASHVKTWMSTFTADLAGSIQKDQALPSGNWSISGTSSWTRGANTYALTVTTNPALHFNASCTSFPRLDAGTLTAVITRNAQTMTVVLQFTACGQPPSVTQS